MIDLETIKKAENGNYSDFSRDIKSELALRLSNNEVIKEYNRRIEYYSNIQDQYSSIPDLENYKGY